MSQSNPNEISVQEEEQQQQKERQKILNTNNYVTCKNNNIIPGRTRIKDEDGYIGTILYVGTVASSKRNPNEIYAGIQWDDPTRGKHNGSVLHRTTKQLIPHFTCAPNTTGSFLKLHKIDHGIELNMSTIQKKYVTMTDTLIAPNNILPHTITTCKNKEKKYIEFIGELHIRKQQQVDCINHISLRCLGISSICKNFINNVSNNDNNDESSTSLLLLEQLKSIDLAGNLLCNWDDILYILLLQFKRLEKLSLASNRILDINNDNGDSIYKNMKVLNLNSCGITSYSTITEIDRMMPNLLELCIASNDIGTSLEQMIKLSNVNINSSSVINTSIPSSFSFSNLTLLDCSNCNITSWETQVQQFFSSLPKLSTLILDDNSIQVITSSSSSSETKEQDYFPFLESIQLAGNDIQSWINIDALTSIPKLTSIRFRNNPITSNIGTGEARSIIIARLPNITHVNASRVSEKERIESERRYVYSIVRDVLSQNTTSSNENENTNKETIIHESMSEINRAHPRFESLFNMHHDSMLSLLHKNKNQILCQSGSLGSDAMNVTIKSMLANNYGTSNGGNNNTLMKRLPATLSIGRLKILCSRSFDVNVEDLLLHFKANADDPFPIELDDDKNSLEYYGIYNGAEILVNEKEN